MTAPQTQPAVSATKKPSPMSTLCYTVLVGKFLPFGWRGPSEPKAAAPYLWISSEDNLGLFGIQEHPSRSWLPTSTQRGRREGKEEHRLPLKYRAYGLQYFDLVNPKTQPQCVLFYFCHFCHFVYFCFVLFSFCTNGFPFLLLLFSL